MPARSPFSRGHKPASRTYHFLKITPTAATIMAKPAMWFQRTGCFRYSTENTENTTSVMTSWMVLSCAALNS